MSFQIDYFTSSGRKVLRLAQNIAIRAQHKEITPDHLLLAMTRATDTNAYHALHDVDVIESKLARYWSVVHPSRRDHPLFFDGVQYADSTQQVFQLSWVETKLRGYDYIGSAHLLIGLMRFESATIDDLLAHFSLERKQVIKATAYYFEYSIEQEKHRIPISTGDEANASGCLALLNDLLLAWNRKRKRDE
ncbi:MAG: Clp protease N-terminal domain-containing protein [Anaerolineae bacterium]